MKKIDFSLHKLTGNSKFLFIASVLIFVGAGLSADLLWNIADITMGGMTLINMPVIIYLGKYVFRALKDYENIKRFLSERGFGIISLNSGAVVDIGSIIPLMTT